LVTTHQAPPGDAPMTDATSLWSVWQALLQSFAWAFTRPGHRRFVEWVTAITDLLANPSARRWLIENGRRRLAADYSRETVGKQLMEVIRAVTPVGAVPEVKVLSVEVKP